MASDQDIGSLIIRQKLDTTEFEENLDKSEKKAEAFAKNIKKLLGALGIGFTLKNSINEALDYSRALALFNQALGQVGFTDAQLNSFKDFVEMAEKNFGLRQADLYSALQTLILLTGSADAAYKLKDAMVNMAIATGKSLDEVAAIISRTMTSGLNQLRRYGIQVTDKMKEDWAALNGDMAAQAKYLNDLLTNIYGGAADAMADSMAGKWQKAINDLKTGIRDIGLLLLPIVTSLITAFNWLANIFGGLPGLIAAVVAALLIYRAVSLATMNAEEVKALSLIGRYIAVGLAKLWAIHPLLAMTAGGVAVAAIVGTIYGLLNLFGGAGNAASAPSNTGKEPTTPEDKEEPKITIVMEQNEFGEWVQVQSKRNGVNDNVQY